MLPLKDYLLLFFATEKDSSKEGEFLKPKLEGTMTKIAALCCQLSKSIWGSNQVCLLNSGFGYISTLPELEKKSIFGTTVFKKKGVGWPGRSDARNAIALTQGKKVDYQAVRKASLAKYPNSNLWLAAMVDSKHMSIMANTWSRTLQKAKRKHCVGGELVEINYSKYMHWYYFG